LSSVATGEDADREASGAMGNLETLPLGATRPNNDAGPDPRIARERLGASGTVWDEVGRMAEISVSAKEISAAK